MTLHAVPTTPEPQLLVLDIEDLTANPHNLRTGLGDLTTLIESIRAQGILQPLVVTETDDHSYLLVAGHRRLRAAIRAGLAEVPAVMRADLEDVTSQVATMLGENDHRAGLTVVEEAKAYQLLLDEGMSLTAVAKKIGRKKAHVQQRLPAARATAEQQEMLVDGAVTLEDLAALDEFADDPDTRAALDAKLGTYNFGWELARARDRRRDAAVAVAAAAELEESGIATITMDEIGDQSEADEEAGHPGYTWQELDEKPDLDELPDGAEVRACITVRDGKATPSWYRRTDPTIEDETPEESHVARASRLMRERNQQRDADLATAAHLRAVHLHDQILTVTPSLALGLMQSLVADKVQASSYYRRRSAALLGFTDEDEPGTDLSLEEFQSRRDAAINRLTLPQLAAALYLIQMEGVDVWLKQASSWTPDAGGGWKEANVLDWRRELSDTWAYDPAPVEQQLIDEHGAPDPAAESDEAAANGDG